MVTDSELSYPLYSLDTRPSFPKSHHLLRLTNVVASCDRVPSSHRHSAFTLRVTRLAFISSLPIPSTFTFTCPLASLHVRHHPLLHSFRPATALSFAPCICLPYYLYAVSWIWTGAPCLAHALALAWIGARPRAHVPAHPSPPPHSTRACPTSTAATCTWDMAVLATPASTSALEAMGLEEDLGGWA